MTGVYRLEVYRGVAGLPDETVDFHASSIEAAQVIAQERTPDGATGLLYLITVDAVIFVAAINGVLAR